MNNTHDDEWLFAAFAREAELPVSFDGRLADVYDTIRRESRGKDEPVKRHMKKGLRTALIIAAAIALLSVSVFAAYQLGMRDRLLHESVFGPAGDKRSYYYSAAGGAPATEAPVSGGELLTIAENGSPEYLALREWINYNYGFVPHDERDILAYDDPHRLYFFAYRNMAEDLDALAERYGLRLWEKNCVVDREELFAMIGADLWPVGDDILLYGCTADVYDDGSFQVQGANMLPAGAAEPVIFSLYRSMKGSLTNFELHGEAPESYITETYTTASGITADLALGEQTSMFFAELDDCYISVQVIGGYAPERLTDVTLTMDGLKRAADSMDLVALNAAPGPDFAEAVIALGNEQSGVTNGEKQSSRAEKAERVFARLGDWDVTGLPAGYAFASAMTQSADDRIYADNYSGCVESAYKTYALPAAERWAETAVELTYERYWADRDCTVLRNSEEYRFLKEYFSGVIAYDASGEPIRFAKEDCQVGDLDAFWYEDTIIGVHTLTWYDPECELVFRLDCGLPTVTPDDLIRMAESVVPA